MTDTVISMEALLKQAGELPSLPEVYIRVTELLESEDSSAIQIGDAVQTDLALNAKVLKIINSAYYGLRNPVTSIAQAVTLMGREQLQQTLVGSVMSRVFQGFDVRGFPLRDFWQHCIKTAIVARQLAMQNARILDHEAFFTAGLLHDIGWLIIAKVNPQAFRVVNEIAEAEGKDIIQVEQEKLGVTHIDVGVELLESWCLPDLIIQCVANHHETEHTGAYAIETSIVYLANRLSRINLFVEESSLEKILDATLAWKTTRCTEEQIAVACQLADEQWQEVMELLGMMDLVINDDHEDPFDFRTSIG